MATPAKRWPTLYKKTVGGKTQEWDVSVGAEPDTAYGILTILYGQQGGKKTVTTETFMSGKNAGRRNATTPYRQAELEAEARWKRQLERKGYGLAVEDSAATRSVSPMLAHDYQKHSQGIDWTTAYGQPKLDGFRCLATRSGDAISLKSREGKPIATMPHVVEQLRYVLMDGEIFDGELYLHDATFQALASAIKKSGDLSPRVQYHVYDMLAPDPFKRRSEQVTSRIKGYSHVLGVKTVMIRSREELMAAQQDFVSDGYEGAMLRHGRSGYEAGKRSKTLLKVKTFVDAEFEVVDAKEGRGTHAGMAVFTCQTEAGDHFDVLAPGTHAEKREYWRHYKLYLGKTLKVKFFEYSTSVDGVVPRFPVGLAFVE